MQADGSPSKRIADELLSWPGVDAGPHRFGGSEFRVGRRQLGHLHGDETADLPLPRTLSDELVAAGKARGHRWRPDSGWVTVASDKAAFRLAARGATADLRALLPTRYLRRQKL
jgi:hypothetical protein